MILFASYYILNVKLRLVRMCILCVGRSCETGEEI